MTKQQHIKKLQKYNAAQAKYIDQLLAQIERHVAIETEILSYIGNKASGLFDTIRVAEWTKAVKDMKQII